MEELEEAGTLANSLHGASITPTPKSETPEENYRPTSLMNTDAKLLSKILANRIQQHIRGSFTMIKWDMSLGCDDGSS